MKAKFTSGKWLVSDNKINSPVRHIVKMPSSKPTKYNGTMYSCIGGFDSETQTEEAKANAHLIAAAPDMYSEIENDIKQLNIAIKYMVGEKLLQLTEIIERKESLLAKARGVDNG